MAECLFTNKVVVGSSPVAVTKTFTVERLVNYKALNKRKVFLELLVDFVGFGM